MNWEKALQKIFKNKIIGEIQQGYAKPSQPSNLKSIAREIIQEYGNHSNGYQSCNAVYQHGTYVFLNAVLSVFVHQIYFDPVTTNSSGKEQVVKHPYPIEFEIKGRRKMCTGTSEREILAEGRKYGRDQHKQKCK